MATILLVCVAPWQLTFSLENRADEGLETAVPFMAFKDAGFEVTIATENGNSPKCDAKMLEGITQKLLV